MDLDLPLLVVNSYYKNIIIEYNLVKLLHMFSTKCILKTKEKAKQYSKASLCIQTVSCTHCFLEIVVRGGNMRPSVVEANSLNSVYK